MQVGEHRVLQRYPRLLLQRLKGLCVIMLSEVLEAKADGFLFSVLRGDNGEETDIGRYMEQRWAQITTHSCSPKRDHKYILI